MVVEVVHVKTFGKISKMLSADEMYVYCGRPSRLKNPFIMKTEADRNLVIKQFKENFPTKDVEELFEYCKSRNIRFLKLGCFCAPKACHCDAIKDYIARLY